VGVKWKSIAVGEARSVETGPAAPPARRRPACSRTDAQRQDLDGTPTIKNDPGT
jgi:hypothetical protein